jgi:hypothetical protein
LPYASRLALAAQTIALGGHELPSLTGYRSLFAICAAAAIVGALIALVIPTAGSSTERAAETAATG